MGLEIIASKTKENSSWYFTILLYAQLFLGQYNDERHAAHYVASTWTSKCAIATLSASGEAHTPQRKEVGTQEPEIPTIAILEQAI